MQCLKGSQTFSSTLSSKETTASSSMHPSTTSVWQPEYPLCATLWARRNVSNKTEPLPSSRCEERQTREPAVTDYRQVTEAGKPSCSRQCWSEGSLCVSTTVRWTQKPLELFSVSFFGHTYIQAV